jgi:hypothetical protein
MFWYFIINNYHFNFSFFLQKIKIVLELDVKNF